MKISGVATLHAPPRKVWAALNDPEVLVATIPGCERLEPAGRDRYRFTVAAAVASIHGSYAGEAALSQRQEPSSFVLTATGAGSPGTVSISMRVWLTGAAGGTTELSYDANAVIGGLIAGVGQLMLSSVARRIAGEFFSSVDEMLAGNGAVSQEVQPAEQGPVPASTGPASTGPASTAPGPAVEQPAGHIAPVRRYGSSMSPPNAGFARGVLVGVSVTLAGFAVRALIGRRDRK